MQWIFKAAATLILSLLVIIPLVSYWVGDYIFARTLRWPVKIPFVNNRENLSRVRHEPAKTSFSFVVLGDIQCGFRTLSRHIFPSCEGRYSFAVQTGDFISHANEGHYALALYEIKQCRLGIPLFVVPGNHDIGGKDPGLFERHFGEKQFHFLWSGCLFIFLDNSTVAPYTMQFQWLERTLQENHGRVRHTFVFMHRSPLIDRGGERKKGDNYAPFFRIAKRFHIDYVFSGHVHGFYLIDLDGTRYVANGAESLMEGIQVMPSYLTSVAVTPEGISDQKITIQASLPERVYARLLDGLVAHIYPCLRSFL